MSPMIPTMRIKFTAYKIRMVEGLFKLFKFEDLRFEFCGGFVAIGRRSWVFSFVVCFTGILLGAFCGHALKRFAMQN